MRTLMVVVLLAGCTPPETWRALPEADKELWQRCVNMVTAARCGPDQDPVYRGVCGRNLGTTYSEQPTTPARKTWLKANGCPPSMVDPEQH